MIISDLAKSASSEHLFFLMQKAYKHGYFVHPEFYEEFDRRAEHIEIGYMSTLRRLVG